MSFCLQKLSSTQLSRSAGPEQTRHDCADGFAWHEKKLSADNIGSSASKMELLSCRVGHTRKLGSDTSILILVATTHFDIDTFDLDFSEQVLLQAEMLS